MEQWERPIFTPKWMEYVTLKWITLKLLRNRAKLQIEMSDRRKNSSLRQSLKFLRKSINRMEGWMGTGQTSTDWIHIFTSSTKYNYKIESRLTNSLNGKFHSTNATSSTMLQDAQILEVSRRADITKYKVWSNILDQ